MADPKTDPVRIVPPSRSPVTPIRRLPPKIIPPPPIEPLASSPLLQPLPKPPGLETNPAAASSDRGPTKETARINILPRPAPVPVAPMVITSKPVAPVEAIPRSLAWSLLAVAAVIFLIQIWNYVVS